MYPDEYALTLKYPYRDYFKASVYLFGYMDLEGYPNEKPRRRSHWRSARARDPEILEKLGKVQQARSLVLLGL